MFSWFAAISGPSQYLNRVGCVCKGRVGKSSMRPSHDSYTEEVVPIISTQDVEPVKENARPGLENQECAPAMSMIQPVDSYTEEVVPLENPASTPAMSVIQPVDSRLQVHAGGCRCQASLKYVICLPVQTLILKYLLKNFRTATH